MPLLEITHLSKAFGGVQAIDDFSISVKEGIIHGLIGPNGAGKTTIFNLITGIYTPDSGKVCFYGGGENVITGKKPWEIARAGLARTFQNIRLFGNLTALENIMIAAHEYIRYNPAQALLRLPSFFRAEKQTREYCLSLLNAVGLADKQTEMAKNLPYGYQRRLEIARALALRPKLLLLDEPAAGMNGEESLELGGFITTIKNKFSITILLIEHHMDVVTSLCDTVTVLNFGKTICSGTVSEIKADARVIEAYLGSGGEVSFGGAL
ncbi:MAG: ABC transporter ATP-binding protein [Spirochaetaceae bacterium]|nr:ABC transporter ATP-binding protein [Spirochaetaceae bacterium]